MTIAAFEETNGYRIIRKWMEDKNIQPFDFQKMSWLRIEEEYSGLVLAPTGLGKTYSIFLGVVIYFLNHAEHYQPGLKLIWITPLRSLAADLARAMDESLREIGLDWEVGVRNGDTDPAVKKRQIKHLPDILIVTPESLHLLLAQKDYPSFFKSLYCIAVDEWHELLSTKRGVMTELAIARISGVQPKTRIWGISATIGNIDQALTVLTYKKRGRKTIIRTRHKKKTEIISVIPQVIEDLPWTGHLGIKMASALIPVIEQSRSTLIFTNTRSQAEMWYQILIDVYPDLAGQIAIHHSSIDFLLRTWIEDNLSNGKLKAVVSTSSLDLGVDFKPVDTVIQIGSPKGVARFLQRAGRSGHSPFETSKIYFVPTHSLELIESAALQEAVRTNTVESRIPMIMTFDVLVQFMVTLALSEGFKEKNLFKEIKKTYAFQFINEDEWKWLLNFITQGGTALKNYTEFHRVEIVKGIYKVVNRRIAMLHRMNIGAIVSDAMIKVKFMGGGYIGMVEEYFISKLKPGDSFVLAGRVLEFAMIKEMTVLVRKSTRKTAIAPSYLGGRLPLSSNLSFFLRKKLHDAMQPGVSEIELKTLAPLLHAQEETSHVPRQDEFLVEKIDTKDGYHLFMYPFEGRLLHEVISALIAYRISRIIPMSFSMAMNDYGFELLSDQPIPVDQSNIKQILSIDNLMEDVISSMNSTEMATRKFRDIAVISGLVLQNYFNKKKTNQNLQASAGLIFNVLETYEPENLLLRQAYDEVLAYQIDEQRLHDAFLRINNGTIILEHARAFTPLSFPIKVDSLRQHLTSENLESRINKLKLDNDKALHR